MFALSAWLGLAGPGRVFEWKSFLHMPQARVTLLPRSPVGSKEAICSGPLPSCMWCSISRRMEKLNYAWLTRKLNKFSNKFTRKRASEIATQRERERVCICEWKRERGSECACVCMCGLCKFYLPKDFSWSSMPRPLPPSTSQSLPQLLLLLLALHLDLYATCVLCKTY